MNVKMMAILALGRQNLANYPNALNSIIEGLDEDCSYLDELASFPFIALGFQCIYFDYVDLNKIVKKQKGVEKNSVAITLEIPTKEKVESIIQGLKHSSSEKRREALQELEKSDFKSYPNLIEPITDAIIVEKWGNLQIRAIDILSCVNLITYPQIIEKLIEFVKKPPTWDTGKRHILELIILPFVVEHPTIMKSYQQDFINLFKNSTSDSEKSLFQKIVNQLSQ